MNPLRALVWLGALLPLTAGATSRVDLPLEALAQRADRVVRVRVVSSQVESAPSLPGGVQTVTTLQVLEQVRGSGPSTVRLVQLGGVQGGRKAGVVGDAEFVAGEEALVFLRCRTQSAPERCTLLGLGAGKVAVQRTPEGAQVLLPGRGTPQPRPLRQVTEQLQRAGRPQ